MRKYVVLLVLIALSIPAACQEGDFTTALYDSYDTYKESSLKKRRIKHAELQPLIQALEEEPGVSVREVGKSIEGRSLKLISLGDGPVDVFLWSQMHGDEPTATQAIFDILNFMTAEGSFEAEKNMLLDSLTIHFLPMLNPDGAEVYQRRNLLGIDINRDALRLQSPEGQALKRVRDSLEADFGFNLHDQSTYYNAERTEKPATVSYLAPAYNYEKEVNAVRGNAMRVIVFMNRIIQDYAPGQVGRYNDDFEPRAFGDNIQKWGTSTILIESGGYPGDPEKQEIRKLNYVSILAALYAIASKEYADIPLEDYEKIPHNDRKLFDLKIEKVGYELLNDRYVLDLGIHRAEVDNKGNKDFYYNSKVTDQGDLSTYYGYQTLNADGYTLRPARIYPTTVQNLDQLRQLDLVELISNGYLYVRVAQLPKGKMSVDLPVQVLSETYKVPEFRMQPERNATFLLGKDGKNRYAVINGFVVDLEKPDTGRVKNSLILR